ncbi:PREDICTED: uncharacterized protein LOC108787625 [Nanorana parkeri]|uniref:uncharacterized protein LOC108787625 n=1 Tax=Nanorana parkeri TaxID=125878 RepID=UPI00085477F1|nr:PREDICTED: uncharacterized protein LOC108787625 [Nanorana parkeri]
MTAEVRILQFSEWDTGKRRLRYLYICPPCSFKLHRGQTDQNTMIPVFLGADVVSQTGVRTENHSKIHAKFAKKGLAARLTFSPDLRFERMRLPSGLNTLWFYSIQGLFKVAFDLYSREEQLAVIESLQELWKSHLKDDLLSECYDLKNCIGDPDISIPSFNQAEEPDCQERLSSCSRELNDFHKVPQSLPAEHNYCMTKEEGSGICHSQETLSNDFFIQRIQSILVTCANMAVDVSEQLKKTATALLDVVEQLLSGHRYLDNMILSIVQLLEIASHLQNKEGSQCESSTVYDNLLLLEVSSWLGDRFHSENYHISDQVEEFKRKHIDRISDLPPAQELVSALFPNAMKVLLLKWMGLFDDASVSKLQSEYPILLLILEFANRNLITGVAHVLYSTLICK